MSRHKDDIKKARNDRNRQKQLLKAVPKKVQANKTNPVDPVLVKAPEQQRPRPIRIAQPEKRWWQFWR